MTFTENTRIAPSSDFGRVVVHNPARTEEMSLQEFAHEFNKHQKSSSLPSGEGQGGVDTPNLSINLYFRKAKEK